MPTITTCDVCSAEIVQGRPWILLNRWGVGTGDSRCLSESLNGDGECEWDLDPDGDDYASGPVVCWPDCAYTFVEAKMIETKVVLKQRGD